ncbi:MAG: hypothetical protein F9K21_02055 [Rhodocyclaceae bacterium]|nr:MAG: hypothetical protein F9K21_02055 [Rhodocyclaceae bacterium]CAG0927537.1 hypothetical protein RHDC3_00444 [Rhodocyclaceae bacterium]
MSLASQMAALASRVAAEIKTLVRPEHPGIARAWVTFGYSGSVIQISASHNVATVTRLAAGRYRITFLQPFADANYCWLAFARSTANSGSARTALARSTSDAKTAAYVDVVCATGNTSLADTTEMNLVVYR